MTTPPVPSADSIEALRQALRALVKEVCDHLKDVEIPVREWTRVVHREIGDARSTGPRREVSTEFLTERCEDFPALASYINFQRILGKWATFRSIAQIIQRDPVLAKNLLVDGSGAPIEDVEAHHFLIEARFIIPFLKEYFSQSQKISFEERLFEDLFHLLASEIQADMTSVKCTIPLINIHISVEDFFIREDLWIRNLLTGELERWINFPIRLPMDSGRISGLQCAIEMKSHHRWPSERQRIKEEFKTTEKVLDVLRLLTDTNIFAAFSEERHQGLLRRHEYGMSWAPSYRRYERTFIFGEDSAKKLKKLWKSLIDGPNKGKVQLALKRFGDTAERLSIEDKLIDYWIALESLFAPESSSEIRYRAALRIASFLGEGEERTKIYRDVGLSYDFRSAVVHANRRRLANLEKKVTLADITERTRGYLRQVLLKILESDEVFDPEKIEHKLLSG